MKKLCFSSYKKQFFIFSNFSFTKRLNLALFIICVGLQFGGTIAEAANSCQQFLESSRSNVTASENDLVRIYAGPGVVIPRQIECDYCGAGSLMPARLSDPRITIMNTTADVQALQERSGGQAPNFTGAAIRCTNCAGHTPLWEIRNPNEPPRPAARTTRLEIFTDQQLGKRYVNLPREYEELARQDSEMNRIARAQHIAICPSCSVTSLLDSRPSGGVQCSGCGDNVPARNIFNTGDLLKDADKATRNSVNRNASGPGNTTRSRRNIQPAPERRVVPTRAEEAQGRSALNRFTKKWIGGGVAALGIIAGGAYYMNNTPIIAEGAVFRVQDNVATVMFQETPYYSEDRNLEQHEVQIVLSDRLTLPGEDALDVQPGDRVTIHYTWSDFHFLPFVFHPYSGAEFFDGSIVDGESIQ